MIDDVSPELNSASSRYPLLSGILLLSISSVVIR